MSFSRLLKQTTSSRLRPSFLVARFQSTSTPPALYQPISGTPAGTPIPEVVIYKTQPIPLALADEEYPAWLWTLAGEGRQLADTAEVPSGRGQKWEEQAARRTVRKGNRDGIKTNNLLKSS